MSARRIIAPLGAAILAALSSAAPSGLLVADAAAQVRRRTDDEDEDAAPLVLARPQVHATGDLLAHSSHRSHSSHSSHRSHYSGSGGGGGWSGHSSGYTPNPIPAPPPPPPPPPKPAVVRLVALPGGRISVNGQLMGTDTTGPVTLKPGTHEVKIENRFLGSYTTTVTVADGQTGIVTIDW